MIDAIVRHGRKPLFLGSSNFPNNYKSVKERILVAAKD